MIQSQTINCECNSFEICNDTEIECIKPKSSIFTLDSECASERIEGEKNRKLQSEFSAEKSE